MGTLKLQRRFQEWRNKRRLDKLIKDHADLTGRSVVTLSKTNPTLAGLTYKRASALMTAEPMPTTFGEMRDRMDASLRVVMDALATEDRRLDQT